MTIVNWREYTKAKKDFMWKHDNDFRVETSPMDEYGRYYKTYICADGALWYEIMTPTYETGTAFIRGCEVKVEIKMLRTEFYSSDDSESKYYYERF